MKKILVIEDNQDVRENIAEILELSGYEVVTSVNGKEGVIAVNQSHPDLILCDVMMPDLDGFGVLKILNYNPLTSNIPFIFLTAKAEKSDFRKGMGLGASDYITKPFDDTELLDAIEIRLKKAIGVNGGPVHNSKSSKDVFFEYFENGIEKVEIRNYKHKDIIIYEGQNQRYVHFIISGKVRMFLSHDLGKEMTFEVLGKNDFFGLDSCILNEPHTYNVSAMENATIALFPKDKIIKEWENDLSVCTFLNTYYSRMVDLYRNKIMDQAFSSVRKKLATALVMLYNKNGGSKEIEVLREELATIAGTAKETTIRTLTDFKNEGLISIEGNNIIVNDLNKLVHFPQ